MPSFVHPLGYFRELVIELRERVTLWSEGISTVGLIKCVGRLEPRDDRVEIVRSWKVLRVRLCHEIGRTQRVVYGIGYDHVVWSWLVSYTNDGRKDHQQKQKQHQEPREKHTPHWSQRISPKAIPMVPGCTQARRTGQSSSISELSFLHRGANGAPEGDAGCQKPENHGALP
jgi:hypothetical protein